MATLSPTEPGLELPVSDLNACDREPIHIPGAIQPHGLLLIAESAVGHRIVAGAGDVEGRLAPTWLDRPLADVLGQDIGHFLDALPNVPDASVPAPVEGIGERFTATLHRSNAHLLVELEPLVAAPMSAATMLAWLDATTGSFERAIDLPTLFARAATAFRTLTGFDRVMIYRFLDDDAGRVVAEDRDASLGSFQNHHFPASDIPKQARALYVRNRTRSIPTIDYVPAPLRPAGFAGCDLSDVAVRHVSPIHLEYLRNMGVGASASISIVKDGLLWGLVACHHRTPRLLSADARSAAAALASGLARQIRAKEEAAAYRERLALRTTEDRIIPRLNSEEPLSQAVLSVREELRAMFCADGFALVASDRIDAIGHCPDEPALAAIARFVRERGGEPFATHELSASMPEASEQRALASGLLALPLFEEDAMLLWLRCEQIQTIEWAGNPHKSVEVVQGERLTPRASFASYEQTIRGRARRWTLEEIEAAHRLRRRFQEARRHLQVRILNRQLGATLTEKDALLAQKDVLMKEVNHRVQNSLQLVASFLRLQAKSTGSPEVADHLAEAQARLAAVALVHRRLYQDDQVESVDLARYIDELVGDTCISLGADWTRNITLELAPILVPTDRAVNIGLVLTELVINASKYAYGGTAGPVAITLEQHGGKLRLIVADNGRGRGTDAEGKGFGSRMMGAMVQRLSGEIEYGNNHPGLRAIMTVPIDEV